MIEVGTIATLKQRKEFFILYGVESSKFKGKMIWEACPKCGKCRWVQMAVSGVKCTDCNKKNRLILVDGYEVLSRLEYFERFGKWKVNSQIFYPCSRCEEKDWVSRLYIKNKNFVRICRKCKNGNPGSKTYRYPIKSKEYREANKEKIAQDKHEYYVKNKDQISEKNKQRYDKNKVDISAKNKLYRDANHDKLLIQKREYSHIHKDEAVVRATQWAIDNPLKARENKRKHKHKKLLTLKGALDARMSCAIRSSLRSGKNRKSWTSLVNYNIEQLKEHLILKFTEGMTVELLIAGKIHIDHKIPISAFNYETSDDIGFKMCWDLNNLQPLWKIDNLKKGNKIIK